MNILTISHKGRRAFNQDLIFTQTYNDGSYLLAVADGMGGYEHGGLAAQLVVDNITAYLSTVDVINAFQIQKAINKSNLAIRQKSADLSTKMGATVGGVVINNATVLFFWVGDVKVWHFRDHGLIAETVSHNLVNNLVANGAVAAVSQLSKYKHVVTRSIQGDIKPPLVEICMGDFQVDRDVIIVCSDGVHDVLDGLQMEGILRSNGSAAGAFEAVKLRLLDEGVDNFSLIVLSQ
ncbi:hypothetical protein F0L74_21640 [Chitinophaga agrisoli]|uniref:PPM-type phosphatase domain-containing protein n=1 Tax=Chitinophaga agrisoli TaxID=2607653 RepID=A0A5B2VJR1_9BACT|nr:protein phosphatase 2C domain-containing protein [Chitinophaga agrisoli]KAA2238820.1 hypothetical protein F0L74_21640 [Chitinophaga agrisoli]